MSCSRLLRKDGFSHFARCTKKIGHVIGRRCKNDSVPFIGATDQLIGIIDCVCHCMFIGESLCASTTWASSNMVDGESNCSSSSDMKPNDSSRSNYSKPAFGHHVTVHCRV